MSFSVINFLRDAYRRSEYNRYMRSDIWHAIRDAKLAIAGHATTRRTGASSRRLDDDRRNTLSAHRQR